MHGPRPAHKQRLPHWPCRGMQDHTCPGGQWQNCDSRGRRSFRCGRHHEPHACHRAQEAHHAAAAVVKLHRYNCHFRTMIYTSTVIRKTRTSGMDICYYVEYSSRYNGIYPVYYTKNISLYSNNYQRFGLGYSFVMTWIEARAPYPGIHDSTRRGTAFLFTKKREIFY